MNNAELWYSTPDAHVGRKGSLYQRLPDPAFLLPQKFNTADGQTFEVNRYDSSAMKLRGYRFIVADYNQYSDSLLVQGLKYKIRIPVYNASFVSTPAGKPLTVRMSVAKTNGWNPPRTKIADYTFTDILAGYGKGNHMQRAEFE